MKTVCKNCNRPVEYPNDATGQTVDCPDCKAPLYLPKKSEVPKAPVLPPMMDGNVNVLVGRKIKGGEMAGTGCLVQAVGVVLFIVAVASLGAVGLVLGAIPALICIIIGSAMSRIFKCENCRGKIEAEAKICPHCKSRLID